MTTCEIKSRTYIPLNWIAVKFCHVTFWGDGASDFSNKWREIEFADYHIYNPKMEVEMTEERRLKELLEKESKNKKWWQVFTTENEKKIQEQIDIHWGLAEAYKQNLFKETYVLKDQAETFLRDSGFVFKNGYSSGGECSTETKIYELN